MDPETNDAEIMNATLDEGVRYLPEDTFTKNDHHDSDNLVSLDLTPDEGTAAASLTEMVNGNPWLVKYLVDGASNVNDPNRDIVLVLDEGNAADDTYTAPDVALPSSNNGGRRNNFLPVKMQK